MTASKLAAAALLFACALQSDTITNPSSNVRAADSKYVKIQTDSGPRPVSANQTYFEFQVEKQVTPRPGNRAPEYPAMPFPATTDKMPLDDTLSTRCSSGSVKYALPELSKVTALT